jgi:hypothetical protein
LPLGTRLRPSLGSDGASPYPEPRPTRSLALPGASPYPEPRTYPEHPDLCAGDCDEQLYELVAAQRGIYDVRLRFGRWATAHRAK